MLAFIDTLLMAFFVIVCILLIVVVLLQKGRGGGLGAAFGGMGSSAFGTRVGDVFTWVTIVLTACFLVLAIVSSLVFRTPPSTVQTPQFRPEPTAVSEDTFVTIYTGTKGATIHFTTDGKVPDEKSPAYTKKIKIAPGTTIKARAYREGWEPSDISTGSYPLKSATTQTSQPATAPGAAATTAPAM